MLTLLRSNFQIYIRYGSKLRIRIFQPTGNIENKIAISLQKAKQFFYYKKLKEVKFFSQKLTKPQKSGTALKIGAC